MNAEKSESQPKVQDLIKVELKWEPLGNTPTVYANQLIVSHAGPEFYIIFGEVTPIDVSNLGEMPRSVPVKPVVKVAVTYQAMQAFISVLDANFKDFVEKMERFAKEHDDSITSAGDPENKP